MADKSKKLKEMKWKTNKKQKTDEKQRKSAKK